MEFLRSSDVASAPSFTLKIVSVIFIVFKIIITTSFDLWEQFRLILIKGGSKLFLRAFNNSELGPPEVAPYMARTFGGVLQVLGHPNMEPENAISPRWS